MLQSGTKQHHKVNPLTSSHQLTIEVRIAVKAHQLLLTPKATKSLQVPRSSTERLRCQAPLGQIEGDFGQSTATRRPAVNSGERRSMQPIHLKLRNVYVAGTISTVSLVKVLAVQQPEISSALAKLGGLQASFPGWRAGTD